MVIETQPVIRVRHMRKIHTLMITDTLAPISVNAVPAQVAFCKGHDQHLLNTYAERDLQRHRHKHTKKTIQTDNEVCKRSRQTRGAG